MGPLLARINSPEDLKKIPQEKLPLLAHEIRSEIIDVVSRIGGHLAPSLGAVELVIALHYVLDLPTDSLIWDMGYQGYAHKLLTGRKEAFRTLRVRGGLCGFSNKDESKYDLFTSGHAGTCLSLALGLSLARARRKEKGKVVAFIGDAALGSGMALEALNHAGNTNADLLLIVNDNKHSIARSVGSLSKYLNRVIADPIYNRVHGQVESLLKRIPKVGSTMYRAAHKLEESLKNLLVPGIIFEELGFRYFGPIEGHDMNALISTLEHVVNLKGPRIVHVCTTKGKGYLPAEEHPENFHRSPAFDVTTGKDRTPATDKYSFTDVFAQSLIDIGKKNDKIVAITAAMRKGTGLAKFEAAFPDRLYDVGIAEQHGVGLASGLAAGGLIPVVAIYSSFLQRAFDQIMHDACLQKAHIIFGIDRAGMVGTDGPTHHGVFDIPFMRCLPNMVLMAPKDGDELTRMMQFAVDYNGPIALRYPRDHIPEITARYPSDEHIVLGKGELVCDGTDLVIIACGSMVAASLEAIELLRGQGVNAALINPRFIKPLDAELIARFALRTGSVLTVEEGTLEGGMGSAVMEALREKAVSNVAVDSMGVPDEFIEHAERREQIEDIGLTPAHIADRAYALVERKRGVASEVGK